MCCPAPVAGRFRYPATNSRHTPTLTATGIPPQEFSMQARRSDTGDELRIGGMLGRYAIPLFRQQASLPLLAQAFGTFATAARCRFRRRGKRATKPFTPCRSVGIPPIYRCAL